jgi:hypothetical protein
MEKLAEEIYDRNQDIMESFFEDERYGNEDEHPELIDDILSAIYAAEGDEYSIEIDDLLREHIENGLT